MNSTERLDAVQDLMEEILLIQKENSKDAAVVEKVQEIIQKSNKLVENSDSANEMIIDAKILHAGSQVVNSSVASFDTHLMSFNEEEYKKGILAYIRNNCSELLSDKCWECLAPVTYHLFRKSNPFTFMLGSLSLNPPPRKEREKQERTKKVAKTEVKLNPSEELEKGDSEENNIYEHILKSLVRCYKLNNKKPIGYFDFIINPISYWQSVENIFYFSFLIRDGTVNLFLNDDGLPVVEPLLKANADTGPVDKSSNQFCFSLSMEDWRACIERFNISSTKIPPLNKKNK